MTTAKNFYHVKSYELDKFEYQYSNFFHCSLYHRFIRPEMVQFPSALRVPTPWAAAIVSLCSSVPSSSVLMLFIAKSKCWIQKRTKRELAVDSSNLNSIQVAHGPRWVRLSHDVAYGWSQTTWKFHIVSRCTHLGSYSLIAQGLIFSFLKKCLVV